jgi:hypothetical protein
MEISRAVLFGKLHPFAYKALEAAAVSCKMRGNPTLELVHWIQRILETTDSDLTRIGRHFELDAAQLTRDVAAAAERLPGGATAIADLSPDVEHATERGWVYATLMFGHQRIRTGVLLVGALKASSLRKTLIGISRQFELVNVDDLTDRFAEITAGSREVEGDTDAGLAKAEEKTAGPSPGSEIFICYRREDSNHFTGRIFDRLVARFGPESVFMDINSIDLGVRDFTKEIRERLESAGIMLVMVGRRWLVDENGKRRLNDKTDYVRMELGWGLKNDVRVLPVLLDGARMPDAASLPAPLRGFSKIQGVSIRSDAEFNRDVQYLVDELTNRLAKPGAARARPKRV